MKKLIKVFMLTLLCAVMLQPKMVDAATTFEDVKVTVVDDLRGYDQKVDLSWKLDFTLDEDAGVSQQTYYGKFTIAEDCYMRIKTFSDVKSIITADDYVKIYGNPSMAVPVHEMGGKDDDYIALNKGTYYIECMSKLDYSSSSQHSVKMMIGGIPKEKAFKVTKTVSQDGQSVTITAEQKLGDEIACLKYDEGTDSAGTIAVVGKDIDPVTQSFTVTKNGIYSVIIRPATTVPFCEEITYLERVTVNEIGAALKKGTTYKAGNLKYKVVTPGLNGTGTVMVTGVAKQKASVTIPKTVKLKGHDYKIVKINNNAFKGKKKIKKITIKSTTITSVGKNAIKGINKKATIKVPKSKKAAYKRLFKKSTGYVKTMKIK